MTAAETTTPAHPLSRRLPGPTGATAVFAGCLAFATLVTGHVLFAGLILAVVIAALAMYWAVQVMDGVRPIRRSWLWWVAWTLTTVTLIALLAIIYDATLARL